MTHRFVIVIITAANSFICDLDKIEQWSKKWAINFNLNFTRRIIDHSYVSVDSTIKPIDTHTRLIFSMMHFGKLTLRIYFQ